MERSADKQISYFMNSEEGRKCLECIQIMLEDRVIEAVTFSANEEGMLTTLELDGGEEFSFIDRESTLSKLKEEYPQLFLRMELEEAAAKSDQDMRTLMLQIAELAIRYRAELDDGDGEHYDVIEDPEGYATSLLTALRHWCHAHEIDWTAEVTRAQDLFDDDMREATSDRVPEKIAEPKSKTYNVGVREINVRYYAVNAADEEQAKALVKERAAGVVDLDTSEYSHELDIETWSVEETKPVTLNEPAPGAEGPEAE